MNRRLRSWTSLLTATLLSLPVCALALPPGTLWTAKPQRATGLSDDSPVTMGAFSKLAKLISPAVVNIHTKRTATSQWSGDGARTTSLASGTGFFIHPSGYLLTNHHVIARADRVDIRTADDRSFEARVVGSDPRTDIALLKVDAKRPFQIIPLGDSDALQIGEWVVAVGNPYGLGHTVTAGIVSAKGRSRITPGSTRYASYIQTDASINPGNSGGPLVNIHGEVIGINTAVHGKAQGIGFAIPSQMVKKLVPQLASGHIERSWLGISVGEVTPEVARALRLPRVVGAYIRVVARGSPAAKAGLRAGDVVLRFDGHEVKKSSDLPWLSASAGVGRKVLIEYIRDNRLNKAEVTMTRLPEARAAGGKPGQLDRSVIKVAGLGMHVTPLSPRLRRRLRLVARAGALVVEVRDGGPAEVAGMRPGDVVIQADRVRVDSPAQLIKVNRGFRALEMVPLYVARGAGVHFVMLRKSRLP